MYVKLVAKPNTWFKEGTDVWDDDTGFRFTKEKFDEAKYRLKYAKKSLKEEIERVRSRNDWLSQLKKAVEAVN
jgi:hypothetical protein